MIGLVGVRAKRCRSGRPRPTHAGRLPRVLTRCTGSACLALTCAALFTSVVASAAVAGGGWAIQTTPDRGTASLLNGVSCSSQVACTAIGTYQTSSGANRAFAERWNGRKWTRQPTPGLPHIDAVLLGVSCPTAKECFAVGSAADEKTLTEQWNGRTWHVQDSGSGHNGRLTAVSCSSSSACTAVGSAGSRGALGGRALAERWTGKRWVVQHMRSPSRSSWLTGVSCSSDKTCMAVGNISGSGGTFAEYWTNGSWALEATSNPTGTSFLYAVSCSAPGTCTAAGYYENTRPEIEKTLAERWNGHVWIQQATPPSAAFGASLVGVSCPSSSDCVATGSEDRGSGARVLAERWNGKRWTVQPARNPSGRIPAQLNAVSCSSAADCTAAGYYLSPRAGLEERTLAERRQI